MDFNGDIVLHQLVEKLGLRSQIKQAEDFEELAKVMQNAYFVISCLLYTSHFADIAFAKFGNVSPSHT